jgi:DNA-binding MarR family transcriptional regulator
MGLIVLPYEGPAVARREQARPVPTVVPERTMWPTTSKRFSQDSLEGIPIRLTYRTTRVLECVALNPGASNRQIGDHAGVSDQGQMSKLLARLSRVGLLSNTHSGHPKGEANAWTLTAAGRCLAQSISSAAGDTNLAGGIPTSTA